MSEELQSCPFCGSARINGPHEFTIGDSSQSNYWIDCKNCPAGMEVATPNKDEIIALWNRRVTTSATTWNVAADWKLVPVVMDDIMQLAAAEAMRFDTTVINKLFMARKVYDASIFAAPSPPAPEDPAAPTPPIVDELAEFLKDQQGKWNPSALKQRRPGDFISDYVHATWQGWQARAALGKEKP